MISKCLTTSVTLSIKSKFNLTLEPFYFSRERTFQPLFGWNTNELKSSSGNMIIGEDFGLKSVMDSVRQVSSLGTSVLITGATNGLG